jgi:aldehyde dehydrogenase (NAD+)
MRDVDRFFIGGKWVAPAGDEVAEVVNPATEEVIARAAVPTREDAKRAIEAARKAFDEGPWPRMAPAERAALVRKVGEILHARIKEIGDLLIKEVGATVVLVKSAQGAWALDAFDLAAEWAEQFPWEEELPHRDRPFKLRGLAVREPVGVVAGMTPFNYPFFVNCWKIAPPIAMGNTVVLKPSPWTPLDAFEVARAVEEAGIPPGVVNVIGGGGIPVGEEFSSHPMVDMVAFTGSVGGGRAVGKMAMETVKKVQLELGGKSAAIALDDTDPDDVGVRMMGSCMIHAGQGCGCTTRLLVPDHMHDEIVDAVVKAVSSMTIGDPADPSVMLGPLIREEHRQRVENYVKLGLDEGARIVTGGRRPPHLSKGYFYEPTVFVDVSNDMRIAQEEIFGPVLCVQRYRDIDEAVAIANDSIFGLGGAVLSPNRERAIDVARRLRTGFVGINGGMLNPMGSWGGYKQSGVGREWRYGIEEFTELKHVSWAEI